MSLNENGGNLKKLKIIFSSGGTGLLLLNIISNLCFQKSPVDLNSIILLIIIAIPYLPELLEEMEINGIGKFKFITPKSLKETTDSLKKANLYESRSRTNEDLFLSDDPIGLLATLRIEIEKKLLSIARNNRISIKQRGAGNILRRLTTRDIIDREQARLLSQVLEILNAALHGKDIPPEIVEWTKQTGPKLIASLTKIEEKSSKS